jgi:hypothetical protein
MAQYHSASVSDSAVQCWRYGKGKEIKLRRVGKYDESTSFFRSQTREHNFVKNSEVAPNFEHLAISSIMQAY